MESGNSGSMSSSGDEEYESRTESIPSFNLNPSSSSSTSSSTLHFIVSSESNHPSDPSLLPHHHHHHHHLFDLSSSNYLQPNSSNPNFLLNLDSSTALRSRSSLRSAHHQHHQPYQLGPPSSSSTHHQSVLQTSHPYVAGPSAIHLQQLEANPGALRPGTAATTNTTTASATTSSAQTTVVRSSKKRTRASRRAPTTVLTTDTSNFRAMVQEFTGIPAPPFSGSSLSFSRRLDLFGSGSAIRSGSASHLEGPLYPLRPSAHKPQTSPFGNIAASSSSSSSPLFSNAMLDATNIASSSLNFQPSSSDHHHHHHQGLMSKQPRNMINMQNPGINIAFQSLPLHPNSLNMAGFGEKQGQGSNLAICTSTTTSALDHQGLNASYQRGGIDSNQVTSDMWRVDGVGSGDSCKLNYAAAAVASANTAEFQTEKGLEINVSTRNEGTVDPWIFPSD